MSDSLDSIACFTDDDRDFLRGMFARFLHVADGFAGISAIDNPHMRPVLAGMGLKSQPRSGWVRIGIPAHDVQPVSNHSGTMLALAFFLASEEISSHVREIALVHDMGEAVIGDFTPHDDITDAEKHRLERLAIEMIFDGNPQRDHFVSLWLEFETAETPAAKLAKDIDRLEMVMQAQVYERRYPHLKEKLASFWDYVDQRLLTDVGRRVFEGLKASGTDHPHPLKVLCNSPRRPPPMAASPV